MNDLAERRKALEASAKEAENIGRGINEWLQRYAKETIPDPQGALMELAMMVGTLSDVVARQLRDTAKELRP